MNLTKNLRSVILTQFKAGDDVEYIAKLYGQPVHRVEAVIRDALLKREETVDQTVDMVTNVQGRE